MLDLHQDWAAKKLESKKNANLSTYGLRIPHVRISGFPILSMNTIIFVAGVKQIKSLKK